MILESEFCDPVKDYMLTVKFLKKSEIIPFILPASAHGKANQQFSSGLIKK